MSVEAQRNYVSSFFIVLISFLLPGIIYLLIASPFKSLPCISEILGVPEAHREAVAAWQP